MTALTREPTEDELLAKNLAKFTSALKPMATSLEQSVRALGEFQAEWKRLAEELAD